MRTKAHRTCDFKTCGKTRGVVSLTIFEQVPYKRWFTIHACPEHLGMLRSTIEKFLKTSILNNMN